MIAAMGIWQECARSDVLGMFHVVMRMSLGVELPIMEYKLHERFPEYRLRTLIHRNIVTTRERYVTTGECRVSPTIPSLFISFRSFNGGGYLFGVYTST